jgi:hypothetical protein
LRFPGGASNEFRNLTVNQNLLIQSRPGFVYTMREEKPVISIVCSIDSHRRAEHESSEKIQKKSEMSNLVVDRTECYESCRLISKNRQKLLFQLHVSMRGDFSSILTSNDATC